MATVTTQAVAYQLSDFQVWNSTSNTWATATSYGQITYNGGSTSIWRLKSTAVQKVAYITDDDDYLNDSSLVGETDPHPETSTAYRQTFEIKNLAGGSVFPQVTFSADTVSVDVKTAVDTTGPGGGDADNFTYANSEMDVVHLVYYWGGTNISNWFIFANGLPQVGTVYKSGAFNATRSNLDATDTVYGGNWGTDTTVVGMTISSLACFVSGTMIETDAGLKPVEDIQPGDLVLTKDSGFKPVMWSGSRTVRLATEAEPAKRYPVRVRAGALGKGAPAVDLYISQQHRVLVKSKIALRMFGAEEVLLPAIKLVGLEGIDLVSDCEEVTYVHFLFDQHEIVYSNGAETESLYTGPEALKSVGAAGREEILALFPQLAEIDYSAPMARLVPSGKQMRKLVERHKANERCLFSAH